MLSLRLYSKNLFSKPLISNILILSFFLVPAFAMDGFAKGIPNAEWVTMQEVAGGKKQILLFDRQGKSRVISRESQVALYPAISRSGQWIAFVEGPDTSTLKLVLMDRRTGRRIFLHQAGVGQVLQPRFSADGRWLAFSAPRDKKNQIGLISLQGRLWQIRKKPVEWIESEHQAYFPHPSSDGSEVVFHQSKARVNQGLYIFNRNTKKTIKLELDGQKQMAPRFSPNDRLIAYGRSMASNWDIVVYDRLKKTQTLLTRDASMDLAPSWINDQSLLFASNRSKNFTLYQIEISEGRGRVTAFVEMEGDLYAPSVSGDLRYRVRTLPDMPAEPRSSFGVARINFQVYMVGGHQGPEHTYPPESFSAETWSYHLRTRQWRKLADRPVNAHGFGLATHKRYVYAFGGFAYDDAYDPKWKSIDQIDRLDTSTGQWKTVARLPRNRSSNVIAQVGTKVYLIGGWDATPKFKGDKDGTFHREIDVFDLETESVETLAVTLPDPLRRALSGVVREGKILLLGGISQGAKRFSLIKNVTQFDPTSMSWTELPELPYATFAPAAGVLDGEVHLFGGMHREGSEEFKYVNHTYRLSDKQWHHTTRSLRQTKAFSQVVPLRDQSLAIFGGHTYEGSAKGGPVNQVEHWYRAPKTN